MIGLNDNKLYATGLAFGAVALASTQDAIVKSMSGVYPVYETVIMRCIVAFPLLIGWLAFRNGVGQLATPHWRPVILRGLVLCSAYFAYVLALASMPMANSVSIYFTMPLFVAAFSGWLLKEKVPLYRWLTIAFGFVGIWVMVRPNSASFQPASLLALYSAFAYALGQMMGRSLSQKVDTLVIANWQNIIYLSVSVVLGLCVFVFGLTTESSKAMAFLTRQAQWPNLNDAMVMIAMGVFSTFAMMAYVNAYRLAPANFVAPFEYSAMIWAVLYGVFLFHDFPDQWTWIGAALVVGAGLFMVWRDRIAQIQTTG